MRSEGKTSGHGGHLELIGVGFAKTNVMEGEQRESGECIRRCDYDNGPRCWHWVREDGHERDWSCERVKEPVRGPWGQRNLAFGVDRGAGKTGGRD